MNRYADDLWRIDHNKESAINWWLKGKKILEERAEHGDQDAIVSLAWYGSATIDDADPAMSSRLHLGEEWLGWLKKAAAFDTRSALQYGLFMESANGDEAARWIQKAANEGSWIAMVQLGQYYAFGFPITGPGQVILDPKKFEESRPKTDPVMAWKWWEKAADMVGWEAVYERLPEELPKRPE
jgi:hypothetical protein